MFLWSVSPDIIGPAGGSAGPVPPTLSLISDTEQVDILISKNYVGTYYQYYTMYVATV